MSATYVGYANHPHLDGYRSESGSIHSGKLSAGSIRRVRARSVHHSVNVNQRRLLELTNPSAGNLLGSMTQLDDGGTQHYHGLLLNATWRKGNVIPGREFHLVALHRACANRHYEYPIHLPAPAVPE